MGRGGALSRRSGSPPAERAPPFCSVEQKVRDGAGGARRAVTVAFYAGNRILLRGKSQDWRSSSPPWSSQRLNHRVADGDGEGNGPAVASEWGMRHTSAISVRARSMVLSARLNHGGSWANARGRPSWWGVPSASSWARDCPRHPFSPSRGTLPGSWMVAQSGEDVGDAGVCALGVAKR
jgi:hypothetical protein